MGTATGVRRRCVVTANPNGDGALTLRGGRGRTYQVVSATDGVLGRLDELSREDAVTVTLEPVRCRGDGWWVVDVEETRTPEGCRRRARRSDTQQPLSRR